MNVLHSLIGIGIERLDLLAQDTTFTNTLNFVSTGIDDICSINHSVLDRFCSDILSRIQYNVKCLIFESMNMKQVLLAADYPNLTKLKIFNFNQDIASRYFTDESFFRRIYKQQITDLTLVNNEKDEIEITDMHYTPNAYARILSFFENLKYLSIVRPRIGECPSLSLHNLPSTTFSSSTLTKLCIIVSDFEDCLSLLDGRLKQLSTLIVNVDMMEYDSPMVRNSDDLPNLKCFSLTIDGVPYGYDTQIVPLLRRMCNLEELTLYLCIENRTRFVDGTQLHNDILIHMSQLHTFVFYIKTQAQIDHSVPYLSNDDIQRTFTNVGYEQVACIVDNFGIDQAICHVFSLPFTFDRLKSIGNNFPNVIYNNVTYLFVRDSVPFKHEFFVRIARSFPLLKSLYLMNLRPQVEDPPELKFDNNQSYSIVEYPHITTLNIMYVHIDYVEQFLHESKTRLPHLTELKIRYHKLQTVTKNFTREATRFNCIKVKQLITEETIVHPQDFYRYFPLL